MATSPPAAPGRIFISYRREETAYPAGWLFDRLADRFGGGQVFKDVDSIQLGDDFVEVITRAVGSCDVLLALIGDEWLTITDEHGRRRLDNPDDFVRLEIEAALVRKVRVIPILVDGARMPRADELPDSLSKLVRRQALELSPSRFDFDTSRLLRVLDTTLAEVRTAQDDAASTPAPAGRAPDPSTTEIQEAPERREHASWEHTPSVPPIGAVTPGGAWPPADQRKPPDTQRRRLSTRGRILAGAAVGVVLILLLIVAITANSGTTPPPAAAVITATSPSTKGIVFRDDFSGRASGWDDAGSKRVGGHYTNGAYRVYAAPVPGGGSAGGSPRMASSVYPSAPQNLRVQVAARRLTPAGAQDIGYGIVCRYGENTGFYQFTIGNDYVDIAKSSNISSDWVQLTTAGLPAIDVNATNRLEAVCTRERGQQAVHLVFSVNGKKVAEATDKKNPYGSGTVGVFAATGQDAKTAAEAEFDNFVVTQV
jgi:hypothetical protein